MKKHTATTGDFITEIPKHLRHKKTLSLNELSILINTTSRMTVFRKLKQLDYISSYSHAGKHYSLLNVAESRAQYGSKGGKR